MATKVELNGRIVYQEGPLFVVQDDRGWYCGHFKTGMPICGRKRWKQKRDALAYAVALMNYEESGTRIDFEFSSEEELFKVNDYEFCRRAYQKAING